MSVCVSCGQGNPEIAKFCLACGSPLATGAPVPDGRRRTVTIVFSDLVGSTALGERLDSESLKEVMSRYFDEVQSILARHGGVVEKFIGDAVMAVFGLPKVHEDDALRAARAAFEIRASLSRLNSELELAWGVALTNRTGVNTGEVVAGDPSVRQRLVTGDAVNLAARLEQAAPPGEVLLGDLTYRLTKDHVVVEQVEPLRLKGKSRPVPAYLLLGLVSAGGTVHRVREPMVGRQRELVALTEVLDRVSVDRKGHMVVVIGPPGVGKSRLVNEFLASADNRITVLRGRCLSYGEGITLWPFAEAIRSALTQDGEEDIETELMKRLAGTEAAGDVGDRLGSLVGISDRSYPVEDLVWAIRRLLQTLAGDRSVVLVLDDVQWGEPTFLDMVERIRETSRGEPLLILCLARPELAELRSAWTGHGIVDSPTVLTLAPIAADESEGLVRSLLGGLPIPAPILERLVSAADGNPLFAEEMVGMLIDEGLLIRGDTGWVAAGEVPSLPIPPGIGALLAARLDALDPPDRSVLERGSVIGQVFYRGAVRELSARDLRPHVDDGLARLEQADYIRPDRARFAGEDAFRFRHILVRDAAYEGMLKRTRAGLHEAFAGWLQSRVGDGEPQYLEILGYHFEQAHRYLAELGPPDDHARGLASSAAQSLFLAGQRARVRGDAPAAANLLSRAEALWQGDDRERVVLLIDLSETREELADYQGAQAAMARAEEAAAASSDSIARDYALMARLRLPLPNRPQITESVLSAEVNRMRPLFDEARDYRGLARLWQLQRTVNWTHLQIAASERAELEVIRYAKLAGDEVRRIGSIVNLASCASIGPTPVEDGIRRCEALLAEAQGNRFVESDIRRSLAVLLAMRGEFKGARDLIANSRAMLEEMGLVVNVAGSAQATFEVEMLAGQPEAAERELRRYIPMLIEIDDRWDLPTNAAMLGLALCRQGRLEEAEEWSETSRRAAHSNDVDAQSRWRRVRALVLAGRSEFEEADRVSLEAVRLLEHSDFLDSKAQMLMERAQLLRMSERTDDAAVALREALELFHRKGNVVGAGAARRTLAEWAPSKNHGRP